jgi:hypothetical protein
MMTTRPSSNRPAIVAAEDGLTLDAYDGAAAAFADDWAAQPAPSDMYDTLRRFFAPGPTADIGCGAGRDYSLAGVQWLCSDRL